jgi:hypothetical protein
MSVILGSILFLLLLSPGRASYLGVVVKDRVCEAAGRAKGLESMETPLEICRFWRRGVRRRKSAEGFEGSIWALALRCGIDG